MGKWISYDVIRWTYGRLNIDGDTGSVSNTIPSFRHNELSLMSLLFGKDLVAAVKAHLATET